MQCDFSMLWSSTYKRFSWVVRGLFVICICAGHPALGVQQYWPCIPLLVMCVSLIQLLG